MSKARPALSSSVCRDARSLLRLTQEELASAAEISVSTVRRCERGEAISDYAQKQIVAALEAQGATFVHGNLAQSFGGSREPEQQGRLIRQRELSRNSSPK